MAAPVYRFLPWARSGLAQGIDEPGRTPAGSEHVPARTSIRCQLDATGEPAPSAWTSTARARSQGSTAASSCARSRGRERPTSSRTTSAAIEFDPPDFPWLFTPARTAAINCGPGACSSSSRGAGVTVAVRADAPLPVLTIAAGRPLAGAARPRGVVGVGAHADPRGGRQRAAAAATRRGSRRQPQPPRLPTAAQGRDPLHRGRRPGVRPRRRARPRHSDRRATQARPAWDVADRSTATSLPLYYFWEFSTAVEDDIESMARRLHGPEHAPPDLGRRRIFAAAGHQDLRQPALPPPRARSPWRVRCGRPRNGTPLPDQAPQLTTRLTAIVARRGTRASCRRRSTASGPPRSTTRGAPAWFSELNTTVAHRIAAALGTEVVRRNQEAFVQAAWEQVGQVREANELASGPGSRRPCSTGWSPALRARPARPPRAARRADAAGAAPGRRASPMRTIAAHLSDGACRRAPRRRRTGGWRAASVRRSSSRSGRRGAAGEGVLALTAGDRRRSSSPSAAARRRRRSRPEQLRPTGSGGVKLRRLGLPGETTRTALVPPRAREGTLPLDGRRLAPSRRPSWSPSSSRRPDGWRGAHRHADRNARHVAGSRSTARSATVRPATAPTVPTARHPTVRSPTVRSTRPAVSRAHPAGHGPACAPPSALPSPRGRPARAAVQPTFVGADVAALGGPCSRGSTGDRRPPRRHDDRRTAAGRPLRRDPGVPDHHRLDLPVPRQLPGSWVLPEANGLEPDTAILLRTNPEFTSAFLVGVNHEMNSELLWRGYPTDQRGTPFQHFWDRVDGPDIELIHQWRPSGRSPPPEPPRPGRHARTDRAAAARDASAPVPDLVIYAPGTRADAGDRHPGRASRCSSASSGPTSTSSASR